MAMVGLMITVMGTCEACALHAMLEGLDSKVLLPCSPINHED